MRHSTTTKSLSSCICYFTLLHFLVLRHSFISWDVFLFLFMTSHSSFLLGCHFMFLISSLYAIPSSLGTFSHSCLRILLTRLLYDASHLHHRRKSPSALLPFSTRRTQLFFLELINSRDEGGVGSPSRPRLPPALVFLHDPFLPRDSPGVR